MPMIQSMYLSITAAADAAATDTNATVCVFCMAGIRGE